MIISVISNYQAKQHTKKYGKSIKLRVSTRNIYLLWSPQKVSNLIDACKTEVFKRMIKKKKQPLNASSFRVPSRDLCSHLSKVDHLEVSKHGIKLMRSSPWHKGFRWCCYGCFCLTKMNRITMIWSLQKHRDCLNMLRSNLSFAKGQTNNSWAPKIWSTTQPLNWNVCQKLRSQTTSFFNSFNLAFVTAAWDPEAVSESCLVCQISCDTMLAAIWEAYLGTLIANL